MLKMSSKSNKIYQIRLFDEQSDYSLWGWRVLATISARGLKSEFTDRKATSTITENTSSATTEPDTSSRTSDATDEKHEQASNIIVSAISDHALRVARSVIGNPREMMSELDEPCD